MDQTNPSTTLPDFARGIAIFLLIICISLFSFWGYQWVNYLLSQSFNVETGSTMYDLFIGLIAMFSSVLIVIGVWLVWHMRSASVAFLAAGGIGFLIKNVLDIINDVNPLQTLEVVTKYDIQRVAGNIGFDLLQVAFWIFVLVYFLRSSFRNTLVQN